MIGPVSDAETAWLERFFALPNELSWASLREASAPQDLAQLVDALLRPLRDGETDVLVLPFVRGGRVTGWYATALGEAGDTEVAARLRSWLGPTYLLGLELTPRGGTDPMARVLRDRFAGSVYRFWGGNEAAIAQRVLSMSALAQQRPEDTRGVRRPLGIVRAAFDRALMAQDEQSASALMAELRQAGRLTQENLRFLDVRFQAGLGRWPQLARDHWLIKTLSDLALPPQTLSDLIEALYRTYVEALEAQQDFDGVLEAFRSNALAYPRLFSTRHGLQTPRIIKAFMLHERLQHEPDPAIMEGLAKHLPVGERDSWLVRNLLATTAARAVHVEVSARLAIEDGQYDRAFEFLLKAAPTAAVFAQMMSCVLVMKEVEATRRFLGAVDTWPASIVEELKPLQRTRLANLRADLTRGGAIASWQDWLEHLARGEDLDAAEAARASAAMNWTRAPLLESKNASQRFATALGNLSGQAAQVARDAIPSLANAFLPDDAPFSANAKPIAHTLLFMLATEEALSPVDLTLISQLLQRLLEAGLSTKDYVSLLTDVAEVQARVGSFAHLAWSIDLCELLAIMPAPDEAQREARLRLFMQVISQARGFAHRLGPQDWIPLEYLLPDYGLDADALEGLKPEGEGAATEGVKDLSGKTIGVYTLAQAAGARAKTALERMFPGCVVVINSDHVCTDQLTALAEGSDVFVFAWKSATHQALYCVKNAKTKVEPIWAAGKGTASILRAVLDDVG